MHKRGKIILAFLLVAWMVHPGFAQEKEDLDQAEEATPGKVSLNLGADLVTRYVWRGQNYGNAPAIQPTLSLKAFGFSLGAWGSYSLSRYTFHVNDSTTVEDNYSEIDLFLSYHYSYFTLVLTDYYVSIPMDTLPGANYFDWENTTTWHTLELTLMVEGPEKFPIQFIAATLIYGADKGKDTTGVYGAGSTNNFSTYLELSYPFNVKGFSVRPFIGGIPFGSAWYGPKAGINNVGINVTKEIPISKKYTLPIQGKLVFNPISKKAYLVFILSI